MNGFVGSRKVTLAKTKYPIAPANMEIGSVHVLKNFNITPILLIRDAKYHLSTERGKSNGDLLGIKRDGACPVATLDILTA